MSNELDSHDDSAWEERWQMMASGLTREREASQLLEERTIATLRERGLLRARRTSRLNPAWLTGAIAASIALFATGVVVGQWLGTRTAASAMIALSQNDPSRTAAQVQRAGTQYVNALQALGQLASSTNSMPEQGREVALAALYAAANEVIRFAPNDPLAEEILRGFQRIRQQQATQPTPELSRQIILVLGGAMPKRITSTVAQLAFFLVLLPGSVQSVAAQAATQTSCAGSEPVGWLGITGLTCSNCVFSYPGQGRPSLFSTEPRITAVSGNSPAAGSLRSGDVLVSIDDNLITTHAGGLRLANLKPGESVALEVRRNGEVVRHRLVNLPAICPFDSRVPGSRARPGGFVDGSAVARGRVGGSMVRRVGPAVVATGGSGPTRVFTPGLLPRASFGFGISCSACQAHSENNGSIIWQFNELPEIYSVAEGSQAHRAGIQRGDVITRISDADITSAEGGRRFGRIQPGQDVRFTFRRGSSTFSRDLTAEPHYLFEAASTTRARDEETLRAARESLEQIRRQELREKEQIDELRKLDERELRELTDRLLRHQAEQTRRLDELRAELERAAVTRAQIAGQITAAGPANRNAATLRERSMIRYSGKLGATDIEVRGVVRPVVRETADEIIIETGDSTIRLKKSGSR